MTDTVFVQGRSGAIIKMDVPTDVHRRERFDQDLAKGTLRLVDPADVIEDPHPRWPDSVRFVLRAGAARVDPAPAEAEPAAEPAGDGTEETEAEQPKKSASKADWVDFAVAQGLDREAAEAMTKDDLVEQFGG